MNGVGALTTGHKECPSSPSSFKNTFGSHSLYPSTRLSAEPKHTGHDLSIQPTGLWAVSFYGLWYPPEFHCSLLRDEEDYHIWADSDFPNVEGAA